MNVTGKTVDSSGNEDVFMEIAHGDRADIRKKIDRLEGEMFCQKDAQVEIEPVHYFAKGLYAREITIPAGTILTGKIHKTEHLNIISKGKISVVTEFGSQVIEAPATIVSEPGTKRAGYALEDTVWTTIHATEEKDLVRLEQELIADSFKELEADQRIGIEEQ